MTACPAPAGDDLPRLAIERTPANDVYLVLTGLGLGREAEEALADPVAFLAANRVEAHTVVQLLQARFEAASGHPPAADPPPAPAAAPARPARRPLERDEAGRPLPASASLLR